MDRIFKAFKKVNPNKWDSDTAHEAYTDNGKVWFWVSNNAACPLDACEDLGIPIDKIAQKEAYDKQLDQFMVSYRKAQANRTPAQLVEERMMAQAAHGKGVKLVNVITGETYTT